MEKREILYGVGAVASVIALVAFWRKSSSAQNAASQQASNQASSDAGSAYLAALASQSAGMSAGGGSQLSAGDIASAVSSAIGNTGTGTGGTTSTGSLTDLLKAAVNSTNSANNSTLLAQFTSQLSGGGSVSINNTDTGTTLTVSPSNGSSGPSIADVAKKDPAQAITSLYQDVLGRAPDAGGLAYWLSDYAKGDSIQNIQNAFYNSSEHQAAIASSSPVVPVGQPVKVVAPAIATAANNNNATSSAVSGH